MEVRSSWALQRYRRGHAMSNTEGMEQYVASVVVGLQWRNCGSCWQVCSRTRRCRSCAAGRDYGGAVLPEEGPIAGLGGEGLRRGRDSSERTGRAMWYGPNVRAHGGAPMPPNDVFRRIFAVRGALGITDQQGRRQRGPRAAGATYS